MNSRTLIAGLGATGFLVIALIGGAIALDAQYQQNVGTQEIQNERVIVDTNNRTPVEAVEYTNNFDTEVNVSIGGQPLTGGGDDYTWYPATGELSWNENSSLVTDGDEAAVTYSYEGRPLSVEKTQDLRRSLMAVLPYLVLLLVVLALLGLAVAAVKVTGSNTRRGR